MGQTPIQQREQNNATMPARLAGKSLTIQPALNFARNGKAASITICEPGSILKVASPMSEQLKNTSSELVQTSTFNGSFKRNYGTLICACCICAQSARPAGDHFFWAGLISIAFDRAGLADATRLALVTHLLRDRTRASAV
jgi:hypothetical protein